MDTPAIAAALRKRAAAERDLYRALALLDEANQELREALHEKDNSHDDVGEGR